MELIQAGYMDNLFYFVGLGVGANMAGSLSRELNKASQQRYRIGRITALDPFIPSNYIYGNFQQVNKNDALFVDMIHTDVGSTDYTGKVDFYPNGKI